MDPSYIQQCRAVGTRGEVDFGKNRRKSPWFQRHYITNPNTPTPPGFLDRPTALYCYICLEQCVRFLCHIFDVYHVHMYVLELSYMQNPSRSFYYLSANLKRYFGFIFFYAHFGLKNNNNLMDRSHFEIQDLTTAHSSGCPWNFLNYLCMSPVVTSILEIHCIGAYISVNMLSFVDYLWVV